MVYKAPGAWAFCKRVVIGPDDNPYMIRWMLFACPWFRIYLHKICRSDAGRDLHDHPFNFISIILWGSYVEHWESSLHYGRGVLTHGIRRIGSVAYRSATFLHAVELPSGKSVWTLVLAGRRLREWGFQTPEGWVPWTQYKEEA